MNRETGPSSANFLRRTTDPYVGMAIICALVTAFILWVSYRTLQADTLITILLLWALVALNVWFGSRYRVWYDNHAVYLRSAGWGGEIFIPFDDISKILENTASASEMVQGNHPLRRVIVFGRETSQPIYISTKHFAREDIDRLIEVLVDRCPNLVWDKQIARRIASNQGGSPDRR